MKESIKLNVNGMSCGHCVDVITAALLTLKGVSNVNVDLSAKSVNLDYVSDLISLAEIEKAITDEGYII